MNLTTTTKEAAMIEILNLIELTPENRGDVPESVTHLVEVDVKEGETFDGYFQFRPKNMSKRWTSNAGSIEETDTTLEMCRFARPAEPHEIPGNCSAAPNGSVPLPAEGGDCDCDDTLGEGFECEKCKPSEAAGGEVRKRRVFESVGVRELEHDDFAEDPYGGMQTQWGSKIEHDPTVCEVWRELDDKEVAALFQAKELAEQLRGEIDSGITAGNPSVCNHGFVDMTPADLTALRAANERLTAEVERMRGASS